MRVSQRSISELKRELLAQERLIGVKTLRQLKADGRSGLNRLAIRLERRNEMLQARKKRMAGLSRLDRRIWRAGIVRLAGVDEAGVGPLAGPVVAAAVVFAPGETIEGVDDSKKLDAATRLRLENEIRGRATAIGIGLAEVAEIDQFNIYNASLIAMKRAVLALPIRPEKLLVDARELKEIPIAQEAVPKGDQNSFCIAAASILAKTYRDRLMTRLDPKYPGYGFAKHKGYGTPAHLAAIKRSGPSEIHRKSFPCLKELSGACSGYFYRFRSEIRTAPTVESLQRIKRRISERSASLTVPERKKLMVLTTRRRRRLSGQTT